uniref:Uncharacterized protein n=1 Tax=Knipowitschia caucasica TaxID=637954 RepID=A0AAV2KP79_KNICA
MWWKLGLPPQRALQDLGGIGVVVLGQDEDDLENRDKCSADQRAVSFRILTYAEVFWDCCCRSENVPEVSLHRTDRDV